MKIIEAEVCAEHVHMLVEIPLKIAISKFYGIFKREKQYEAIEQFSEVKYKYRNREFWCKGYYVNTSGKNSNQIAEYIRNQLKEDWLGKQLTISNMTLFKKQG